jgi:hypothetical protein
VQYPSSDQLEEVERHLLSFSDPLEPPEKAMLDRVKAGEWSIYEQRFVEHELLEADLMKVGDQYDQAHQRVLELQGIAYRPGYEAHLYHPEVIAHPQLRDWFSAAARTLSARFADEGTGHE